MPGNNGGIDSLDVQVCQFVVWCGMVCYGMVWCGVVCCGVMYCDVALYGVDVVWYCMVLYGVVLYGLVWYCKVWYCRRDVWYCMVLYGVVLCVVVWCGMVLHGTARHVVVHMSLQCINSRAVQENRLNLLFSLEISNLVVMSQLETNRKRCEFHNRKR